MLLLPQAEVPQRCVGSAGPTHLKHLHSFLIKCPFPHLYSLEVPSFLFVFQQLLLQMQQNLFKQPLVWLTPSEPSRAGVFSAGGSTSLLFPQIQKPETF